MNATTPVLNISFPPAREGIVKRSYKVRIVAHGTKVFS